MPKAIWNNTVIAEAPAESCQVVEGNIYFPMQALKKEYFRPATTQTTCFWKGVASYYNIEVAGKINPDAAWYYPEPKEPASNIRGHVAFWRGVRVER